MHKSTKYIFASLASILLAGLSCQQNPKKQTVQEDQLPVEISIDKIWETDTLLTTSEAVIYHSDLDVLFVSASGDKISLIDTKKEGIYELIFGISRKRTYC